MTDQRVTIRQLARLSGVSIGTVSRALNGYTDVNPDTRERIVRLAQELDYTPAAAARRIALRSHCSPKMSSRVPTMSCSRASGSHDFRA